ncbi:hypothetical protein [Vibrio aestuarianus]|uniref:hypothetical protein n=1 Tax=Vibrio aestuarianus TaxID=28171 RepID=UPI00237C67D3|nr:hypothetical protein [Vibrio aestuarianus]MDE1230714.1 hypothetical protein [Vibrio aestuarianus]
MEVRSVEKKDASLLLDLMHHLDSETQFMLLEPDERNITLQEQEAIIESFQKRDNQVMFVASKSKEIHRYVKGIGNTTKRSSHSMYCVIGIRQDSTRKGLGGKLFKSLESWIVDHEIACYFSRTAKLKNAIQVPKSIFPHINISII